MHPMNHRPPLLHTLFWLTFLISTIFLWQLNQFSGFADYPPTSSALMWYGSLRIVTELILIAILSFVCLRATKKIGPTLGLLITLLITKVLAQFLISSLWPELSDSATLVLSTPEFLKASIVLALPPLIAYTTLTLLVPQGFQGIELSRTDRRVKTGKQS